VTIAVLGKPRGNQGEVTAVPMSDKPERFQALREVFLFGDGSRFEVEEVWEHQQRLIFKFRGIDNISDAEPLRGAEVRVPAEERASLDEGEYFQDDLIGCEVRERSGELLGRVTSWQDSGGPGLLEIEGGLLIPFAKAICVSIDVAAKQIVVDLPEGLKEVGQAFPPAQSAKTRNSK
jgi:16S rRNA processing protein RimM